MSLPAPHQQPPRTHQCHLHILLPTKTRKSMLKRGVIYFELKELVISESSHTSNLCRILQHN
jgi:hypothetical protein